MIKDRSVYNSGIVWTGPLHAVREKSGVGAFNRPWMDNLNSMLLFRYWKKKGCPGMLYTYVRGVKLWHKKIDDTIMSWVETPDFLNYTHNKPL